MSEFCNITMPYIRWTRDFETGIDIIDEQHRGLISLINTFFYHKADQDADLDRFLIPTAEMLKAYSKLHFMTLERLMNETSYPVSEIQREAEIHAKKLDTLIKTDDECRKNRDADTFLKFLRDLWSHRDCSVDSGYIAHIRKYYQEHCH
jgi:hemerythrin